MTIYPKPIVYLADYLRPWKLLSFVCGIGILLIGSVVEKAMDWDFPISFIMAISTYIFAPMTARTLFYSHFRKNWKYWLVAILELWLSVDGMYWLYWSIKNPSMVTTMRDANFFPSLCLYLICGFIWLYDGSLKDLYKSIFTR